MCFCGSGRKYREQGRENSPSQSLRPWTFSGIPSGPQQAGIKVHRACPGCHILARWFQASPTIYATSTTLLQLSVCPSPLPLDSVGVEQLIRTAKSSLPAGSPLDINLACLWRDLLFSTPPTLKSVSSD